MGNGRFAARGGSMIRLGDPKPGRGLGSKPRSLAPPNGWGSSAWERDRTRLQEGQPGLDFSGRTG
jgi:hypothetical protein